MKEKHIAGWITTALVIIVGLMSFPYVWFQIEVDEFQEHKFIPGQSVRICIDDYKNDTEIEIISRRDKNVVLSALQNELDYAGPLWYRTPFQIKGEYEIYCIRIDDYSENSGSWNLYVSDNPRHNFLNCGENFNARFAVNSSVLEVLREYT